MAVVMQYFYGDVVCWSALCRLQRHEEQLYAVDMDIVYHVGDVKCYDDNNDSKNMRSCCSDISWLFYRSSML